MISECGTFVADVVADGADEAEAAVHLAGIEAGGQFRARTYLLVELFEFKLVVAVDDVFGGVAEIVDAEIGLAHFREHSGQVVDIADLEIFAAFGFPLVAIAVYRGGVELRADGNTYGALENAGKTQGLGIAQVGAGIVGQIEGYRGGGCPAAAFLLQRLLLLRRGQRGSVSNVACKFA